MPEIVFKERGWASRHKSYETQGPLGSGMVFFLSGSRKWQAQFGAIVGDGRIYFTAQAGTPDAAVKRLVNEIDLKSIGLWNSDETVMARIDRLTTRR
jgi:hypothetical protein